MRCAGFGRLSPIAILDDQPGTTPPQFQPVGRKDLVNIFPGSTLLQIGQDSGTFLPREAFKGLLARVRFHRGSFTAKASLLACPPPVINGQAVFLFQLPTQLVALKVVAPRLHPRQFLRVDQIVCNMHMDVLGIDVHAAMTLMLCQPQGVGKSFFDPPEYFRCQLPFIFRVKADKQMVGFFFAGAPVKRLSIRYFLHGQVVVIASPASGAPAHKTFFRHHGFG